MSHRLSRITKVNPREVWKHEALNFTKWLALEEKIAILCEELEFNLENVTAEAATDKLYVDWKFHSILTHLFHCKLTQVFHSKVTHLFHCKLTHP
jgi:hypothetical protein